jgi:hypothetical protein
LNASIFKNIIPFDVSSIITNNTNSLLDPYYITGFVYGSFFISKPSSLSKWPD